MCSLNGYESESKISIVTATFPRWLVTSLPCDVLTVFLLVDKTFNIYTIISSCFYPHCIV